jgi:hypothetical protein
MIPDQSAVREPLNIQAGFRKACTRKADEEIMAPRLSRFFFSRSPCQLPDGYRLFQNDGWHFAVDPALPVVCIVRPGGSEAGWLVGYPIDSQGKLLPDGESTLGEGLNEDFDPSLFERWLYGFGGRFIAVVLHPDLLRLYTDPSGALSAVYSSKLQAVASTAAPLDDGDHLDLPLREACLRNGEASGTWFPLGFTHLSHARILLPNHYLDLKTWTAHRHWPCAQTLHASGSSIQANITRIAIVLRRQIGAVAREYPVVMNLTAGRDSRMLLACARDFVDRIHFETLPLHSEQDVWISRLSAEAFALRHQVKNAGNPGAVLLTGFAGEVGRSFYWRDSDLNAEEITASQLFERLKFVHVHDEFLLTLERWLQSLKGMDVCTILDLAYIEFRLGCCMGPVLYREDACHRFAAYPFNHREIFQAMLALPPAFRMSHGLFRHLVRLQWPELLLFPVNAHHHIGLRKYFVGIRIWICFWRNARVRRLLMPLATRGRSWLSVFIDDMVNCFTSRRRP